MSRTDGPDGPEGSGRTGGLGGTGGAVDDGGDGTSDVDHRWVMETTFVVTIVGGAPLVAVLSVFFPLDTWDARVAFAVRVGAVLWLLTALSVYGYARRYT